ncbi:BZ3500_MvSof-1268-A1-R1_Chr3-1g06056 [Microbotryum saponariae]|uniref:Dynactin subunit 6 n=1 Tax=Microbotryum saponariae TaxID=289078 RepID=A0A2X0M444_9BASI|nr:BZ3500_MvSof-1268-A1-R1_Chr3-1g06056 [Microbotryum saponariae]SDA03875.1 BZ3501_MvSof-1269-A2-R1_Chr3-2g05741 [Microbotryum saponariae]
MRWSTCNNTTNTKDKDKDSLKIGSRCVIVQDCDLRGHVTIGAGCVIHPRATIFALSGPIHLGDNNIVEEMVVIINRSKTPMIIGNDNHFQVACRIESPSIGSNNIFSPRCRVVHSVTIGSDSHIGAGCVVLASPFPTFIPPPNSTSEPTPPPPGTTTLEEEAELPRPTTTTRPLHHLPDETEIFGSDSRQRLGSKQGIGQIKAFQAKHLIYLRETLVKYHKLKIFPPGTVVSENPSGIGGSGGKVGGE